MPTSRNAAALAVALLSSLAIAPLSLLFTLMEQEAAPAAAQAIRDSPSFPLPDEVAADTRIRIDGSSSMIVLNETLKQRFERRYPGTRVELEARGTEAALDALRDGVIDLAAVSRPLTEEEQAQGFVVFPVSREKIAIFVGAENPFEGDLTFEQFAQIFRGNITDWSELGGDSRPIRFIDRNAGSDTRQSLSRYEVFQSAPFEAGDTAVTVDDDTMAVIAALEGDGIGYGIASQVLGQGDVSIIPMHQTLPDDPAYPYSQPRGYVYYQEPTPAAAAFLGFSSAEPGQDAIADAREAEAIASVAGEDASTARVVDAPSIGGILYSTSLAYSPDGTLIAAASDNGTIRLFDADGNAVGEPLGGLTGRMSTLAFSPDGTRLVGATDDGSIQFWDLDGNPLGNPFSGHDSAITGVVFSPDGESIATAGADGTVRRWSREGTSIGEAFKGHEGTVTSLAFNPNGETVASGGADGTVRLWTIDGEPVGAPFTGHAGAVNAVAFNPAGTAIASAGIDGTVRQWTLDGTAIGVPFEGHEEAVNAIAFVPGRADLLSAGASGVMRFSDRTGQATGDVIESEQRAIAALGVSPDGESFVSGSTQGTLQPWATDGTPLRAPVEGFVSSVPPTRQRLPGVPPWLWWLMPLALLALLLWWLSQRSASEDQPDSASNAGGENREEGDRLSPHLASALALAEAGKKTEALDSLDKAVRDEPTNTLAWTARGNVQNDLETPGAALQSFDKALAIQADAPQALVGKGIALTKLGQPDAALPLFDRAVTVLSQLPDFNISTVASGGLLLGSAALSVKALSGKGFALLDAQRPQDALDAFDAALRHDSGTVDAIAGRNRALSRLSGTPTISPPSSAPPTQSSPPSPHSTDRSISQADRSTLAGAAALAAVGGDRSQSTIAAMKFDAGQQDLSPADLADVDQGLPELPDGYGESRIVLLPCDPQWAYAYWDIPNDHKVSLRHQGGKSLALRLYDVTNLDRVHQNPHSMQQMPCHELARDWYIPIPVSDRDYLVEIGYLTGSRGWLVLARSEATRIPPVYPSDWFHDQFMTVNWNDDLQGKHLATQLPSDQMGSTTTSLHDPMLGLAQSAESLRVEGSVFGSMQQVPQAAISSYVLPSGMGIRSASGAALMMSGIGMSGVGFSASAPPLRSRRFWLVADAELIVHGATEPDATLTVGDRPIPLNSDGTFRFQMSFQDGEIGFPIKAVAADGEQQRSIRLEFERETPNRHTNPKDEATDEPA